MLNTKKLVLRKAPGDSWFV